MFLSKVRVAPGSRGHLSLLKVQSNGAYAAHQLLWQLFGDDEQRQFLFRQEDTLKQGLFYVLSVNEPVQHPAFAVQSKVFKPELHHGQRLLFNLRANPTICIDDKRHDVLMHAKLKAREEGVPKENHWQLMEQAAQDWICSEARMRQWGVHIDTQPVVDVYMQHRSRKRNGHDVSFSSIDYQGVITINDVDRFWRQYCQGFGRARALGCGLMLIRRAL